MAVFGPIPLQAGFTSMGELADLIMKKKQMQQEAELKKYEIEQMAPYKTAQMNYQNALTASLPMRYLTPQGKAFNEQSHMMQGGSPAGTPQGQPIVPGTLPYYDPARLQNTGQPQNPGGQNNVTAQNNGQLPPLNFNDEQFFGENSPNGPNPNDPNIQPNPQNQPVDNTNQPAPNAAPPPVNNNPQATSADQYNLERAKKNIPAAVLNRNLFATNIDKTLDQNIGANIDDLTAYNGPLGKVKLKEQQVRDFLGLPTTSQYEKYVKAEGKFDFIIGQIRQFYGDSIQPSEMAEKRERLDPRVGYKSAKIAKARFQSQKELLKNELQTYRDATKNTDVYTGGNATNEAAVEGQMPPEGNVWMMTPEGEKVPVHKSNVSHAMKEYGFKKVE